MTGKYRQVTMKAARNAEQASVMKKIKAKPPAKTRNYQRALMAFQKYYFIEA